jgi:hypothetical protein
MILAASALVLLTSMAALWVRLAAPGPDDYRVSARACRDAEQALGGQAVGVRFYSDARFEALVRVIR